MQGVDADARESSAHGNVQRSLDLALQRLEEAACSRAVDWSGVHRLIDSCSRGAAARASASVASTPLSSSSSPSSSTLRLPAWNAAEGYDWNLPLPYSGRDALRPVSQCRQPPPSPAPQRCLTVDEEEERSRMRSYQQAIRRASLDARTQSASPHASPSTQHARGGATISSLDPAALPRLSPSLSSSPSSATSAAAAPPLCTTSCSPSPASSSASSQRSCNLPLCAHSRSSSSSHSQPLISAVLRACVRRCVWLWRLVFVAVNGGSSRLRMVQRPLLRFTCTTAAVSAGQRSSCQVKLSCAARGSGASSRGAHRWPTSSARSGAVTQPSTRTAQPHTVSRNSSRCHCHQPLKHPLCTHPVYALTVVVSPEAAEPVNGLLSAAVCSTFSRVMWGIDDKPETTSAAARLPPSHRFFHLSPSSSARFERLQAEGRGRRQLHLFTHAQLAHECSQPLSSPSA